jgi:hypothetical protein
MSGRHFEILNSGAICTVRDLNSSNGTFVNGVRIAEQPLNPLDLVAAGSSKFRLQIEAVGEVDFSKTSTIPAQPYFEPVAAPPPQPPPMMQAMMPPPIPPPLPSQPAAPENPWQHFAPRDLAILNSLFGAGEPVYAILDATKDMLVRAFVEACGEPSIPLTETLIQNRPGVGSYLLSVPPSATKLLDVLVKDGWGKGWGVYCTSTAGMDAVATHIRNTVNVYTSTGLPFQLRLQDPNLLRWFLPGLLPHEATSIMGPISRFVIEASVGKELISFTAGSHGLAVDSLKLES